MHQKARGETREEKSKILTKKPGQYRQTHSRGSITQRMGPSLSSVLYLAVVGAELGAVVEREEGEQRRQQQARQAQTHERSDRRAPAAPRRHWCVCVCVCVRAASCHV